MGFLSFLKVRKESDDAYSHSGLNASLEIKSQPYDATAVALPPIRGGLPVAGNGPNTLTDLKRASRKRSEAQLSTRTTTELSAPAPMVPRLRSKSLGRPSTAPTVASAPLPHQRPKSAGRNSNRPPFLVQKTKPGPPYLLGMTGPDADVSADAPVADLPPPVPPIAAQFVKRNSTTAPSSLLVTTPVSTGPASVTGSAMSGGSAGAGTVGSGGGAGGARYVDILDAQGAFKPSDFKTRLRATGARDYGEDVAERNLGVNGVDLNSPAVVAFYALTGGRPLAYKSDGSAVDVHGNKYAAGNIPTDLATTVQGKDRDELSALANQRIRTPRFPQRTTSLQPRPLDNGIPAAAGDLAVRGREANKGNGSSPSRRMSVHGGPVASSSAAQSKPRPLSMHPVVSNFTTDSAIAPDIPRIRRTTSPTPADLPFKVSSRTKSRDSTTATKNKKKKNQQPKDQLPRSRSAKGARTVVPLATSGHGRDTESEKKESMRRSRSASSTSLRERKQRHEVGSQTNLGILPTGAHMLSVPSYRLCPRGTQSHTENASRPRLSTSSATRTRNRSIGASSMSARPQLDDIDEIIPCRRSSWRNESVSSMAPSTTATTSTHLSGKHSRHTADTSLDLGYSLPSAQKQMVPNDIGRNAHVRGKSSGTTVSSIRGPSGYKSQRAEGPSPSVRPLEMVDYATSTTEGSDIESYVEKRRRRRHDDEALLFKEDGYGQTGGSLPGLFDSFDVDKSTAPIWSSVRAATASSQQNSRALPPTSAPNLAEFTSSRRVPTVSLPRWEYDDGDSSSVTTPDSDPDVRTTRGTGPVRGVGSILAGDGCYDPEEEAMDEKLDVRLAVRLRKEMKRRERASIRRQTLHTKPVRETYDQGHVADTEI
ncbi:hypothetical protein ACRE_064060 [Hapsidospora chrysogenum ATCC 11550]|uniref:Uncharacterized protein n=1 Tax=Hapsidospora chrysogenum (strain ATCC 11550 / CBS 779.69 / DSM 880 / IAM 14645 / JCM 23072 / IMI 49137) TaxID=857340 RepID=A0A086T0H6_HAPC1|nr:hypothetical protein ACRE_064060 [Hapsidospora chrysogenum ATCC 11550]